jgi:drug/metabolite transporter (DMT)-like permease
VVLTFPLRGGARSLGPALLGAASFACADVLSKVTFREGGDALTVCTLRGLIGVGLLVAWLALSQQQVQVSERAKWISLGLGALFAANVFLLFTAIAVIDVAVAILTYFVYPLLTGIAAAIIGIEKLTWRGTLSALLAFVGLGMMLGASHAGLASLGVLAALAAACCRVLMLLITRAEMHDVDPLATTLYTLVSSTVLLLTASAAALKWQPPLTPTGWIALLALSISVMTGILGVFASTVRIGPFRTALFMNLEPLLTAIGSVCFLDEVIVPLQALGGAVMIAALTAFHLRR